MTEKLHLSNPDQHKQAVEPTQAAPVSSNPVSPKKLLLSKWSAVTPQNKEKHFLVVAVVQPEILGAPVTEVDLEAALTGRVQRIVWRELKNASKWKRGWI
jgi:tryptophan-rich hypothetical protein